MEGGIEYTEIIYVEKFMQKKIIGIIPARYQSVRLPGKPLIPILGKSLIQHTYENAKQSQILTDLIVATDDDRIFKHVLDFGGSVVMTSSHCINGTERIAEVLQQNPQWLNCDAVVNIQGDEPCICPKSINDAVQILLNDPTAQMSTLVTRLTNEKDALNPSFVKCIIDCDQNAIYFSRALIPSSKNQQFNPDFTYYKHIGFYVYRPHFVLEYQKLSSTPLQIEEDLEQLKVLEHGYKIKVAVTDHASPGVDTPHDLANIEWWLCKQNTSL